VGDEVIPLSQEDRAILALESETVEGHTCKLIVLGDGAPGVDELRGLIGERVELAPALCRRLGGSDHEPAWVADDGFDIAKHVVVANAEGPLDRAGLNALTATLFAARLDRERPLWRIDVAPLEGGGTALVWRLHHAVADGTTAMRYARLLLWGEPDQPKHRPRGPAASGHEQDDARRRAHLAMFLRREYARGHTASPFDGRIGTERRVAFATVPLAELHDAAHELAGATVNDGVLAVLAGALRHWLQAEHGSLGDVRVKVPVSLHHEGDDAGNRDSFFTLPLPLNEPDPVARLRAVAAATATRKHGRDAEEVEDLHRDLAHVSPRLAAFCDTLEHSPRRFALNVSNVPGPRAEVSVGDAPVSELYSLAEIGERHALRVAIVSCAGTLGFGFCADPAIVSDVDALAGATEDEAQLLLEASSGGSEA